MTSTEPTGLELALQNRTRGFPPALAVLGLCFGDGLPPPPGMAALPPAAPNEQGGEPPEWWAGINMGLCAGPRWPAGPLASQGAVEDEALGCPQPPSASSPRPPSPRTMWPSPTWQRGQAAEPGV